MLIATLFSAAQLVAVQGAPNTNVYLIHPNMEAALARSQQQCIALGCDGKQTVYWWNVIPLKDGTAAIEIQDGGQFAAQTQVKDQREGPDKSGGLAANEVAATVPAVTIAPLLATPSIIGSADTKIDK